MAAYRIFFKSSVWKDFKSIPDKDFTKVLACIESLSDNPRPSGCKQLSGREKYRLRYGRYRILYTIQDNEITIWIVKIRHRKKVYS